MPKRGKKSWREIFGTIGVKVRSRSRSKFRKFDSWSYLKRTESRFWSHAGQKHHLVTRWSKRPIRNFRLGAPKIGKKSWGETLRTTDVKFLNESEVATVALCNRSLGMALCTLHWWHSAIALCTLQSATKVHRTRCVRIENFDQERVFRFGPLHQWSPSKIFYPFWSPHGRKLESVFLTIVRLIGAFHRRATKTRVRSPWGATMCRILKILTWRDFGPLRQ